MTTEEILTRLQGVKPNGSSYVALCPAHEDKSPSLSVSEGEDGRTLLKCFAGCSTEEVVGAAGLSMSDLFEGNGRSAAQFKAVDRKAANPEPIDPPLIEQMHRALTDEQRVYLRESRMLTDEVIDRYKIGFDESHGEKRLTIPIADAEGKFVDVRRWLPSERRKKASTKILHWQKGYGAARLFPLDQVQADELVLCEGELDALALIAHSIPAITATCGVSTWSDALSELFKDKEVTILLDHDEAGQKGAQKRAKGLVRHGAKVKMAPWPKDRPKEWDVTDELRKRGVASLRQILDAAAPFAMDEQGPGQADGGTPSPYQIRNSCLGFLKKLGQGDDVAEIFVPLCNFVARVVADRALDDGAEVVRHFVIELQLNNGRRLPRIEVSAAQFTSMSWVVREAGAKACITAGHGSQDRLREAIQVFSTEVKEQYAYAHTGWRQIDGCWHYLHAGLQEVQVALEPPLDRYALPEAPEDVAGALRRSLALLEVAPDEVTIPLLAAVYLAPLCQWLHPDFGIFLVGKTGSLKSTLAALFLSHYGGFDRTSLPGSWESTDNALERRLFTLKDTLCVVDDYAPRADAYAQRQQVQRAQRIIRSMGNLSGRSRLRADLSERPAYVPRGLMLSTGEDLPPGQSILSRILSVEVDRGLLELPTITQAQQAADRLPHAMAGFLEWLKPQLEDLADALPAQWQQHRVHFSQQAGHLRIPEILAYLALGIDLFTSFAQDQDVLSPAEVQDLAQRAHQALLLLGEQHGQRVHEEDPAEIFLTTLSAMLAQGKVLLAFRNTGETPENMIGWKDDDHAYLIPDAARQAVGRYVREGGGHFSPSPRALNEALDGRGALVKGGDGKTMRQVKILGKNRRVLQIPLLLLEPEDEDEEGEVTP